MHYSRHAEERVGNLSVDRHLQLRLLFAQAGDQLAKFLLCLSAFWPADLLDRLHLRPCARQLRLGVGPGDEGRRGLRRLPPRRLRGDRLIPSSLRPDPGHRL